MKLIPVRWTFKKKEFLHIFEVTGEGNKDSEPYLIKDALEIIKTAQKYKGRVDCPNEFPKAIDGISISFTILFRTKEDIEEYEKYLGSIRGI